MFAVRPFTSHYQSKYSQHRSNALLQLSFHTFASATIILANVPITYKNTIIC